MYFETFCQLKDNYNCKYLVFDTKKGSFENVIESSLLLRILDYFGYKKSIVLNRKDSWEVTRADGAEEQFEKLTVYLPPIVIALKLASFFNSIKSFFGLQSTPIHYKLLSNELSSTATATKMKLNKVDIIKR